MIVADLHIHSRYSRATARNLDPEHLWIHAQLKGVDLVGSGDFTHPAWFEELSEKLVETGDGAYALKPDLQNTLAEQVPGPANGRCASSFPRKSALFISAMARPERCTP